MKKFLNFLVELERKRVITTNKAFKDRIDPSKKEQRIRREQSQIDVGRRKKMVLNPERIYFKRIIFNVEQQQIQQNGIDLKVYEIYRLTSDGEIKPNESIISKVEPLPISSEGIWDVQPGYYGVSFQEGLNLPASVSAEIKGRSSLLRSGVIIKSGFFDSGFHTKHIGCFMLALRRIKIHKNSRLAQIVFFHSDSASLYEGRYNEK